MSYLFVSHKVEISERDANKICKNIKNGDNFTYFIKILEYSDYNKYTTIIFPNNCEIKYTQNNIPISINFNFPKNISILTNENIFMTGFYLDIVELYKNINRLSKLQNRLIITTNKTYIYNIKFLISNNDILYENSYDIKCTVTIGKPNQKNCLIKKNNNYFLSLFSKAIYNIIKKFYFIHVS